MSTRTHTSQGVPPGKVKKINTEGFSAAATLLVLAATLVLGWQFSSVGFMTPESGLGYALGIVGSVMMVIMLIYPLRKRIKALQLLGSVKQWFRAHMMLGVLGPTLVVLHTNFSLGSTNSRVALFCMVVVALSGLVGRYLYRQIHSGLYGQRTSLNELRKESERFSSESGSALLNINGQLEELEKSLDKPASSVLQSLIWPFIVNHRLRQARRHILQDVREKLEAGSEQSAAFASHKKRMIKSTRRYLSKRLGISRRMAMFRVYEKLFSLWHVLHIPLFVLLVIAALVHIYAVHAY